MSDDRKPAVRVIALGHEMASDDGAALRGARELGPMKGVELILAGRPGPGLLDLLDPDMPTVLLDVVRVGTDPGSIVELRLGDLATASIDGRPLSSHGLGVAQSLRLAEALDRPLPRGIFLGIGGRTFDPGTQLDPDVELGIGDLVIAARAAIDVLKGE